MTMARTRTFSLLKNPQLSSSLIQLPCEIQLMILRILLKFRRAIPIDYRGMEDYDTSYDPKKCKDMRACLGTLRKDSQLLRTCQYLYPLCQQVLYKENTLTVYLKRHFSIYGPMVLRYSTLRCSFLNNAVRFPTKLYDINSKATHFPKVFNCESRRCSKLSTWLNRFPVLRKFSSYQIMIHMPTDDLRESIFMACLLLREVLYQKTVTLKVIRDGSSTSASGKSIAEKIDTLSGSKILKCNSITFPGYPSQSTYNLSSLITNKSAPVTEMYELYASYMKEFISNLPSLPDYSRFEDKYRADLERLKKCVLDYDVENFKKKRRIVTCRAYDWIHRCAVSHKAYHLNRAKQIPKDECWAKEKITELLDLDALQPENDEYPKFKLNYGSFETLPEL